jgi:hypothetical protein
MNMIAAYLIKILEDELVSASPEVEAFLLGKLKDIADELVSHIEGKLATKMGS